MSFEIARSGINAINEQLETTSNNIANAGTYGFKGSRVNFAAMYGADQPMGVQVGSKTQSIEVSGNVVSTGRAMDVAIQGRGFFVSRDTTGRELYSRVGIFNVDKQGAVVDGFGRKVQGYALKPGSSVLGAMGDLLVPTGQVAAQATTKLQYVGNLSADWSAPVAAFDKTDPTTFNSSMVSVVYDSLGAKHSVTQYFVKTGSNQVTAHYTFDGADLPATQVLNFGPDGQLTSPTTPFALALGTPAGASPLSISMDYSTTSQFAGETSTTKNNADGYSSGTLTGVEMGNDGSVLAQYSNGQKQAVGKLALATFANEGALATEGNTSWAATADSGVALYAPSGVGQAGALVTGSLEQSNVDMTAELVSLMTSQRNYQANTKVISTVNEMSQSLMQAL